MRSMGTPDCGCWPWPTKREGMLSQRTMNVAKCEVCRGYYRGHAHRCDGLPSVDWVRFSRSLRHWMSTDKRALFEAYYVRHRR